MLMCCTTLRGRVDRRKAEKLEDNTFLFFVMEEDGSGRGVPSSKRRANKKKKSKGDHMSSLKKVLRKIKRQEDSILEGQLKENRLEALFKDLGIPYPSYLSHKQAGAFLIGTHPTTLPLTPSPLHLSLKKSLKGCAGVVQRASARLQNERRKKESCGMQVSSNRVPVSRERR